mmetsp:Transcript_4274/g.12062  ORF Transcript_4274/g.12062 Transcript_4274/m.12062 type:complete len:207 (+) Transcript_4274:719-1339(+)
MKRYVSMRCVAWDWCMNHQSSGAVLHEARKDRMRIFHAKHWTVYNSLSRALHIYVTVYILAVLFKYKTNRSNECLFLMNMLIYLGIPTTKCTETGQFTAFSQTTSLDILLQIRIGTELTDVGSKGLVIREALSNEVLGTIRYLRRRGEPNISRVEHNVVGKDMILRLSIAERPLAKEHLIEDYANRPNIDLVADANALMRQETLGW